MSRSPLSYRFLIEFAGDFAGTDVAALEVEGAEAPVGDLLVTLPLDRLELASLLRAFPSANLPLEIRIVAQEDDNAAQEIVALFVPVTIQRPLAFPELDETPTIDWLRFPSPKSYLPAGANNNLTGEKIYATRSAMGRPPFSSSRIRWIRSTCRSSSASLPWAAASSWTGRISRRPSISPGR
ncbi:MAG: hypothetical protein WDN28_10210 [Chthoniobacter sp.]